MTGMSGQHYQDESMRESLRQMLALLEHERQAFAALDLEKITSCAHVKARLCDDLAAERPERLDDECRGMLDAAKRLNEANRKLRNLVADNVHTRLTALAGATQLYKPQASSAGGPVGNVHRLRANSG